MWAVAVAMVGAVVVSGCTPAPGTDPDGGLSRPEKRAVRMLTGALSHLAWVPVIRYQGDLGSSGSSRSADLRVSQKGAVFGSLREDGERIRVLGVAGLTFIKADAAFYSSAAGEGENRKRKAKYLAKRWVKVDPKALGDPASNLRPQVVAQRLLDDFDKNGLSDPRRVEVAGVAATRMSVGGSTLYVSDSQPHRLLRVQPARTLLGASGHAGQGLSVRPALNGGGRARTEAVDEEDPAGFGIDDMGPGEVGDFYNDLRDQARKLRDAVDSDIKFSISTKPLFVCNSATFICRASIRVKNKVAHGRDVKDVSGTVQAILQGMIFGGVLGARPCADTAVMKPNGRATMRCVAAFPKPPPRRHPQTFPITGQVFVVAQAVIKYKKIIRDLKHDRDRDEDAAQCAGGTPGRPVNARYVVPAAGSISSDGNFVETAFNRNTRTARVGTGAIGGVSAYDDAAGVYRLVRDSQQDGCGPVGRVPTKVVNSNMGHIDRERAARAGFDSVQAAREAVRNLSKSIAKNGFPKGTINDTARVDRVLVPIGENGYAVYQIKPNGNAVFKTILIRR